MKERGDTIIGEAAIKFGIEYRDLLNDQGVLHPCSGGCQRRR